MSEERHDEPSDRLVLKLDPGGGPVELTDLTNSFAALARMYERHYRPETEKETAPRLYITKLETGSIVAEIAPYAVLLGTAISTMDSAMVISDFSKRISAGIRAFGDPETIERTVAGGPLAEPSPSREDARDIREFVKPLTGRNGAKLGVRHARFEQHDGERHTIAEYTFDEAELNRAAVNIDHALASGSIFPGDELTEEIIEDGDESFRRGVTLFFQQASRGPGRESGRTGDRGIIPDISTKALPVYYRKSLQNLKDRMIKGDVNPLTDYAFVVDVFIQKTNGVPKAYVIVDVREIIPLRSG
jgi:hypothetical protein